MSKFLLREYYELCEGGVCQDLLTEEEKKQLLFVAQEIEDSENADKRK